MKRQILLIIALAAAILCPARQTVQPQPKYLFSQADFPQLTKSYNAQGMAIYGDFAFALHDKGSCAVYNLRKKNLVSEFNIASAGENNHCNVAFFGTTKHTPEDFFPLLYVSQANGSPIKEIGLPQTDTLSQLLFVERVITDNAGKPCRTEIVKLIHYQPKHYVSRLWAWDPSDPACLYCYGNVKGNALPGNRVAIKKFNYPTSDDFLIELTDDDVIETFYFDQLMSFGEKGPQDNILQGAIIRDGIFYLPIGTGGKKHPAELFYADLNDRGMYGHIEFTQAAPAEPEDVDVWGDKLVMCTNRFSDETCPFYTFSIKELKKSMKRRTDDVKDNYSVVILGDTHFDAKTADVYHSDYNEPTEWLNRVQRAEFARNGQMWSERCPRMVDRASRLIAPDTKFVFQTGDLIQGDCGNPDVHEKMLDDVMNMFKSQLGGLPFVTVTGNHDIRGTGAKKRYHEYMPKRMSRELKKEITQTTYYFTVGPDAFIVVDFNAQDVDQIKNCLKQTEGARYTFILTHGPLFPYDAANARWFLFGKEKFDDIRREMRAEFARREVICLCGHTHRIECADWYGDGGRITQMTMSSVWSSDDLADCKIDSTKPEEYGTLRKGVKKDDGTLAKDETPLFEEYRCGLKRYFHAKGAGSFKLDVSSKGVIIYFYGGDSVKVTRTFTLRPGPAN